MEFVENDGRLEADGLFTSPPIPPHHLLYISCVLLMHIRACASNMFVFAELQVSGKPPTFTYVLLFIPSPSQELPVVMVTEVPCQANPPASVTAVCKYILLQTRETRRDDSCCIIGLLLLFYYLLAVLCASCGPTQGPGSTA